MADQRLLADKVQRHYTREGLGARILKGLEDSGKDINHLNSSDLALVDEFHVRGRKATFELAIAAGIGASLNVLDVGSGIGGPARFIASEFGCRVTGIDLTEEYCRVAEMLTEKVGFSRQVTFRQGDALSMPFSDGCFDVVWTQHTSMNIQDKDTLYREMYRVLKSGGTLAIYDILAGPSSPVHFPVPWSYGPETSFLVTPDELRRSLTCAGFSIATWTDSTEAARIWFQNVIRPAGDTAARPLGLGILLGDDAPLMTRNQLRNLEEGRITLCQVTAVK